MDYQSTYQAPMKDEPIAYLLGGQLQSELYAKTKQTPFQGMSELEIACKDARPVDKELARAAVICNFFICQLPFDC